MAITKSSTLKRVLVLMDEPKDYLQVTYHDCFDDPNDDELPLVNRRNADIPRYDNDGNPTDLSGYEQVVQDIAAIVWADAPASEGE